MEAFSLQHLNHGELPLRAQHVRLQDLDEEAMEVLPLRLKDVAVREKEEVMGGENRRDRQQRVEELPKRLFRPPFLGRTEWVEIPRRHQASMQEEGEGEGENPPRRHRNRRRQQEPMQEEGAEEFLPRRRNRRRQQEPIQEVGEEENPPSRRRQQEAVLGREEPVWRQGILHHLLPGCVLQRLQGLREVKKILSTLKSKLPH